MHYGDRYFHLFVPKPLKKKKNTCVLLKCVSLLQMKTTAKFHFSSLRKQCSQPPHRPPPERSLLSVVCAYLPSLEHSAGAVGTSVGDQGQRGPERGRVLVTG